MEQIRLDNADFEGRNNIYLLDEEPPITLVDTGIATPAICEQLVAGLDRRGLSIEDVEQVLLTHWHADHTGLAGTIQRAGGASVHIHERDAWFLRADSWADIHEPYRRCFEEWRMPSDKCEAVVERLRMEVETLVDPVVDFETFVGGDTFNVGAFTVGVQHAPGHTAGLSAFVFDEGDGRHVFSGDALLPEYTPNIGGDFRVENPLGQYVETLTWFAEGQFERAYPGHRDVIEDPSARAAELLGHHRKRTSEVVDALREHGPLDVWSLSHRLFGELVDIHILQGPGEAAAHLEHLRRAGAVASAGNEFELVDPDVDVDALFPAVAATDGAGC